MTNQERPGETRIPAPVPASTSARSLADLLNRVLDRGVVLGGDVTLSVAGVDLVFLRLSALLTSVATAREKVAGAAEPAPRALASPDGGVAARLPSLAREIEPRSVVEMDARPEPIAQPTTVGARSSGQDANGPLPDALAAEIVRVAEGFPQRVEIEPEAVQRDLARLVLTIVELLRRVVEHQAVRRMDDPSLSEAQIERMGIALDRLDQQMREMKALFGLADEELNIDLGDLGTLL